MSEFSNIQITQGNPLFIAAVGFPVPARVPELGVHMFCIVRMHES